MHGKGLADIRETQKLLKWTPKIPLETGLLETHNWLKENISLYSSR